MVLLRLTFAFLFEKAYGSNSPFKEIYFDKVTYLSWNTWSLMRAWSITFNIWNYCKNNFDIYLRKSFVWNDFIDANLCTFIPLNIFYTGKSASVLHRGVRGHNQKTRKNSMKSRQTAKMKEKAQILAPENFQKWGNQLKRGTLTPLFTGVEIRQVIWPISSKMLGACKNLRPKAWTALEKGCLFSEPNAQNVLGKQIMALKKI